MPYGNAVWTKIEHIRICPVQEPVEDYGVDYGWRWCDVCNEWFIVMARCKLRAQQQLFVQTKMGEAV